MAVGTLANLPHGLVHNRELIKMTENKYSSRYFQSQNTEKSGLRTNFYKMNTYSYVGIDILKTKLDKINIKSKTLYFLG